MEIVASIFSSSEQVNSLVIAQIFIIFYFSLVIVEIEILM